jgi:hypothetical protein
MKVLEIQDRTASNPADMRCRLTRCLDSYLSRLTGVVHVTPCWTVASSSAEPSEGPFCDLVSDVQPARLHTAESIHRDLAHAAFAA